MLALRRFAPLLAIALLALVLSLPFAFGPQRLHDSFWIDWVWVDQFGAALREGQLYPRWLPASHDGLGSPVFYYYPPLAFYPAGILRALGASPDAAIAGTFGLAFLGSGLAMYFWLRDQARWPLAGALLFMAAPYHLADVYGRGALAESVGIALLPLLALGLRRATSGRGPGLAALSYGALIMTHLPLALLASLFLVAPYGVYLAWRRPSALPRLALPLLLGIGLAAIYLLPALWLEPWRDAAVLWADPLLQPDHWLLTNLDPPLNGMRLITLKVLAVAALPCLFLALRWRNFWAFVAIGVALLVVGVVPFFWDASLVHEVQFPFRALPFVEFGFATALAFAPNGRLAGLLALPALALSATFLLAPAPDGGPVTPAELARHPDVPENLPPGPRPYSWPSRWALALAAAHRAPVTEDGVTIAPVFYFPAVEVTCGGEDVAEFRDPPTGLLAFRGSACSWRIGRTEPELFGAALSLATLALLLALIFRRRTRRNAAIC